jgi:hypothetical protein
MKKCLTERPRYGSHRSYKDVRAGANRGDLEDLPKHEGMERPHVLHGATKSFSDLLGPLRRYLWSCLGQPWDEVWSTVCSQLSNNTVDSHLKGHVRQEVATDTVLIDGVVYERSDYGGQRKTRGLYVHPATGLLCGDPNARSWWKGDREPVIERDGIDYHKRENDVLVPALSRRHGRFHPGYARLVLGLENEAVSIGGVWYWVTFLTVPPPTVRRVGDKIEVTNHPKIDFVTGGEVREGRYRGGKRQMSSADLRRHGLKND